MKKLLTILLTMILFLIPCLSLGCNDKNEEQTVSVKYFKDASEMIPMLKNGVINIGLLPEPAATQLTKVASDKTWYRLDVQELYDSENKSYPQAVMLVKQSVLNTFPNLVEKMENAFSDNVLWVKENTALAVDAVNSHLKEGVTQSLKAGNITSSVVDGCKIYWQGASEVKVAVKNYIDDILNIEPNSAKAVADDLFYNGESTGEFNNNTINVVAPDGAPALAIAKFINDNENFGTEKDFSYTVVSASSIGSAVQKGEGDIVIIPVNAATKLYKANANDGYKLVSVITHGNLYIMSTEKITSIKELKDKTVGVIGQGNVPDLTFKAILKNQGIRVKIVG